MNNMMIKKLDKVRVPILIIRSTNDQVSTKENIELLNSKIISTDKKIFIVNQALHSVFDTNPDLDKILTEVHLMIKKNL